MVSLNPFRITNPFVSLFTVILCLIASGPTSVKGTPGELLWQKDLGVTNRDSGPTIGLDGTIYISTSDISVLDYKILALNPDGTEKWTYEFGQGLWMSPVTLIAYDEQTIYSGSVVLGTDGSVKWDTGSLEIRNTMSHLSAVASDGTIVHMVKGGWGPGVHAISSEGKYLWKLEAGHESSGGVSISMDNTIYFGNWDQHLYALNLDGTLKWKFKTDYFIDTTPAIDSDGTIYIASKDEHLYAINPNGSLKWAADIGNWPGNSPVIGPDGSIYLSILFDNKFIAIAENGESGWELDLKATSCTPTVGADGTIYICSDSTLYAVSSEGIINWTYEAGNLIDLSSPALDDNGIIYICSDNGHLYAIDSGTGAGLADSPWPTFGHDMQRTGRAWTADPYIVVSDTLMWFTEYENISTDMEIFRITNTGEKDLVITSISVDNSRFSVTPSSGTILPLSEPLRIAVNFETAGQGDQRGTLTIVSNAVNTSVRTIKLASHAEAGDIVVDESAYFLSGCPLGGTMKKELIPVRNEGSGILNITEIISDNSRFSATAVNPTVTTSSSDTCFLEVNFTADSPGNHFAKLKIVSDSWRNDTLEVDVVAWGGIIFSKYSSDDWYSGLSLSQNGTIYSQEQYLVARNSEGDTVWTTAQSPTFYASWILNSLPTIASDGTVYFLEFLDNIYNIIALTADGEYKWTFTSPGEYNGSSAPFFANCALGFDGTVYVPCYDSTLYAINQEDGTIKWSYKLPAKPGGPSIVGGDGTIYLAINETGTLLAFNPDGSLKWQFGSMWILHNTPAIGADGTVYIASRNRHMYAISHNGREKWKYYFGSQVATSVVIDENENIIFGAGDSTLYALTKNGSLLWEFEVPLTYANTPTIGSDGTIYVFSLDGSLYAVNPDGTEKWRMTTGSILQGSPVISDDGIIYLYAKKYLYNENEVGKFAYFYGIDTGTGAGLANTPWPTFCRDLQRTGRADSSQVTLVEPGDADGNGMLNIFDLLGVLKALKDVGSANDACDVNGDGKVDIFDLLALLKMLAR